MWTEYAGNITELFLTMFEEEFNSIRSQSTKEELLEFLSRFYDQNTREIQIDGIQEYIKDILENLYNIDNTILVCAIVNSFDFDNDKIHPTFQDCYAELEFLPCAILGPEPINVFSPVSTIY